VTTIPEEPTKMSARVLVADDSSTMRKIILRSLSAVGIPSAIEAADGEEAINLFQPGEFDLVLTDWNMPRKNGLEVIQEIRKQDTDVTIIMVTTEAEKSRVLEAIQAGVSDYLVKPFTADTLREKLEKHGC
jgi:two-component system chemotaxis response regulator CheY